MTPWIGLETAPDTLEPGQTRAPSRTSAFDVSITAEYELKVTVRWNISMTNGSEFKNEYVKSLQVARFKRVDGKNTDRVVITNDIYLRQMETGISPGYLLDRSCYFHMINVTFQNNLNIIETTELKCFDFSSPSWLIVYLVAFVGILVLACIMFHLTSPKVKVSGLEEKTKANVTIEEQIVNRIDKNCTFEIIKNTVGYHIREIKEEEEEIRRRHNFQNGNSIF
ncbi:hypothetical protein Q1695_006257 [Nippostrongylus brasiliensis]|nr:hypothetical protein Q1695_006257 [Nippostrongylus brasiliensis]